MPLAGALPLHPRLRNAFRTQDTGFAGTIAFGNATPKPSAEWGAVTGCLVPATALGKGMGGMLQEPSVPPRALAEKAQPACLDKAPVRPPGSKPLPGQPAQLHHSQTYHESKYHPGEIDDERAYIYGSNPNSKSHRSKEPQPH